MEYLHRRARQLIAGCVRRHRYIGSGDGIVYALSIGGMILSSFTAGGFVDSSPAIVNGIVYAGSSDGHIVALNGSNLTKVIWSRDTGPVEFSSPAVDAGAIFIGSHDNNIYALNAGNGKKLWSFPTAGPVDSSPAVAAGVAYVGSDDHHVYAVRT